MKTILVVDGYNAINAVPEAKKLLKESLLSARSKIIMLTEEYVRSSGYITDFHVVFDGETRYRGIEKLNVPRDTKHSFSKTGEGDERILDAVRKYSEKARVILASNDNYIRNNARGYGASLMDSEELAGRKKKKERKPTRDEKLDRRTEETITREYMEELGL